MPVLCQCPGCHAKFQVGEQYAGRKIKCPKCSAVIPVAGAGQAEPAAVPAAVPAAAPASKPATGPAAKPAAALPKAVRLVEEPEAPESPAPWLSETEGGTAHGVGGAVSRPHKPASLPAVVAARKKKKSRGIPPWAIAAIAAGGVTLVVGLAAAFLSTRPARETAALPAGPAGPAKKAAAGPAVAKPNPVLPIDWPERERAGGAIFVDDAPLDLPRSGEVQIPLAPRATPYKIRLVRKGFEPLEFRRLSQPNEEQLKYQTVWVAVFAGVDWPQDFDEAKKQAEKQGKDVLVLFDRSGTGSDQFARSVAMRPEFRTRADKEYVCIYVDAPQSEEGKKRVASAPRNQKLAEQFGITAFPTLVATDAKGRVFAFQERCSGSVTASSEVLDAWHASGAELKELLAQADSLPAGQPKTEAIGKVLDFMEVHGLARFHPDAMRQWQAAFPAGEGRPVTKSAVQAWVARFERAQRDPSQAIQVVAEFDQWKKTRKFADRTAGAGLHFTAAVVLAHANHKEEAIAKCKEGLAMNPPDSRLRAMLSGLQQALGGGHEGPVVVGTGTGFCIAANGYLLTNHHVIAGAKKVMVRFCGQEKTVEAKVLAETEELDMALLKVEVPAEIELKPVPLVSAAPQRGDDVCALGYPGIGTDSPTPIFTKGTASGEDVEKRIITDCKVNPGNSGGPLCNTRGAVVGMVTAKSRISTHEDSYGLAIPADKLRAFLQENLPAAGKLPAVPASAKAMPLNEVYAKLSPSVVFIENTR